MYARIIYCAIDVYTYVYIYKCVSVTIYVSVLFSRQVSMAEISSERNSKSESPADGHRPSRQEEPHPEPWAKGGEATQRGQPQELRAKGQEREA